MSKRRSEIRLLDPFVLCENVNEYQKKDTPATRRKSKHLNALRVLAASMRSGAQAKDEQTLARIERRLAMAEACDRTAKRKQELAWEIGGSSIFGPKYDDGCTDEERKEISAAFDKAYYELNDRRRWRDRSRRNAESVVATTTSTFRGSRDV